MAKSRPTSSAPRRAVFSSSTTKPSRASGSSTGASKKANNVSGYTHRQSLKDPSLSLDPLDAFDLITQKHKRSEIDTDLTRDEAGVGKGRGGGPKKGGDDEEDDGDAVRERIRQMIASGESMGVVEDEDDEEVDSDGAWEEMGEEQMGWGGAFVTRTGRGKKGGNKSKAPAQVEVNLDEDEDLDSTTTTSKPSLRFQLPDSHNAAAEDSADDDFDSDEGGSTGFMDLSTMLDGPMSDREDFDDDNAVDEVEEGMSEDDDEDEEDSDSDEDEEMSEGYEDEEDEGALDQLGAFVSGLKSAKRKAGEDGDDEAGAQRSKRRVLKDRGEDGRKEGDFGAPLAKGTKLSLASLLQPLPQSSSHSLLQTAKALAPAALAAPLPTRAQDKLDREAAYDATKEEVEKWAPAMKRIKEAEHLSFPLQAQKKATASSSAMTAKFKPSNDLESAVANLLASAQMSEANLAKTEDLAMNHLTIEEVAARREELGRLRELMFRAEAKNKRVAKIKSKAYRKIAKKEREKNAQKIADAGFESGEGEDGEEAQMERERKRATERATLRHKNTGKWAKSMLGRTELDVDQRRELNEQLQQGDRLKKKIQSFGDEDGAEESSSEEEGEDVDAIRRRAHDQLEDLENDEEEEGAGGKKKGGGLFGMKFMQDGMKRAQVGADAEAEQARRDFGERDGDESGDDEPAAGPSFVSVGGNKGRMLYGTGAVTAPKAALNPPSEVSVASTSTLQSSHLSPPVSSHKPTTTASSSDPAPESNPWLAAQVDSKQSRKKNLVTGGKDAQGVDKVAAQLKKGLKKTDEGRARERDDAEVEIDLDVGLLGPGTAAKKGKGKAAKKAAGAQPGDDEDESEDGEDDLRVGPTAFRQRDLVAQAFAGDNVIEDFAAEKRREEEEDAPKEEDLTLPGWGAWGGRGVKKSRNPKKFIKKVAGIDVAKRHDFGKSNVIISEKKDKKAAKYQTKDLPYPYTSAAQYEASLSQAVGTEWATRSTHQKLTMPRVVVKTGAVIHPLHKNAA